MHALGAPWGRERGQPDIRAYLWLLALLAGIAVVISIGRGGVMDNGLRPGPSSESDRSAGPAGTPSDASTAPRVYLGVWQPPGPWEMGRLAAFEQDAGKRAAIVHFYIGWAANEPPDRQVLTAVAAHGSVPMITWEPWGWRDPRGIDQPEYSLAAILSGRHDPYIRTWARALAAHRGEVLLRWAHEMNTGLKYPWTIGVLGNTPEQYVAAWRHLRRIFAAEGATNVRWVWSPNIDWDGGHAFEPMFPGDAEVDWLGLDGYNNVNWGGWRSFAELFGDSYRRITALSEKPLMLAEVASGEAGGSKADWITDALAVQIPEHFPRIRAVVWFNEDYAPDAMDYRIESSAAAKGAFSRAIASPLYGSVWNAGGPAATTARDR